MSPFGPGEHIALREIWNGKLWFANPAILVEDGDTIAFFTRAGAVGRFADRQSYEDGLSKILAGEWNLVDREFHSTRRLAIARPGDWYAVSAFWRDDDGTFIGWYVDMIHPLRRSRVGFDFRDLELDIVIAPDLSSWAWKDEDLFETQIRFGLHTPDEAAEIRRVGEEVIAMVESGDAWWTSWGSFVPDLPVPVLPDGWDVIERSP